MTEASFQAGRRFMQSANGLRSAIKQAEGAVAKWSNLEDWNRRELKHPQADGAKKQLEKAMQRLSYLRNKFAKMKFPDSNILIANATFVQCGYCYGMTDIKKDHCILCGCKL